MVLGFDENMRDRRFPFFGYQCHTTTGKYNTIFYTITEDYVHRCSTHGIKKYVYPDCSAEGVGAREGGAGVGGALVSRRLRLQKPAFGPLITNESVHRESPRRVSGRCTATVSKVESDRMNVNLEQRLNAKGTISYTEPTSRPIVH